MRSCDRTVNCFWTLIIMHLYGSATYILYILVENSLQNKEEEARLREGSSALIVTRTEPSNELVPAGGTLGETLDTTGKECLIARFRTCTCTGNTETKVSKGYAIIVYRKKCSPMLRLKKKKKKKKKNA
ncbi:unnamed protein product [Eruca vesicaria subsp. sativa]|uniref:Uncharacterized protein n=1 Tax=Eruca vesicaria subsp. sativa TaxID=29727 RepID=A0ABC8L793_ERUVS|nr:unnamed protein product [Eruca vesicaria subsp. sativa]